MINTLLRLLLIFVISTVPLYSQEEKTHLRSEDVKIVMSQIFDQHVHKKTITTDILKNSFRIYIDQFDPDRIYLLESEVRSFTDLSKSQMKRVFREYERDNFAAYEKLNRVIQLAIKRAQDYRKELLRHPKSITIGEEKPFDYSPHFVRTIAELKERQKRKISDYLSHEVARFGSAVLKNKETELFKAYDKKMRESEGQYLFTNTNGRALSQNEKENLFVMHIIKALAKSLDAHTSFFTDNEAYDMRVRLEKGFDGIGIVLAKDLFGYRVIKLINNSPASLHENIEVNDYLVRINGKMIDDYSLSDVMKMLRGKKGTIISLQLKRESKEGEGLRVRHFNVLLKREPIVINEGRVEVTSTQFGDGVIGTITLHSFYQGNNGISSENDVREAIEKLQKQGNLKGLVLDLRENSGGFLTQAVKVAGLFITNGVIVVSKYSSGEQRFYRDMDGKISYDGPLIVLTSRATASAAEIVAQALQDYGVALVVGDEQTYGKGTIQSQTVTSDNNEGSFFKVTVGKYYTVSGKTPQVEGVKADVIVPSPYSLEQIGEEYLEYPLDQDRIPDSYVDSLSDIDPGLRPWYLRYYMPTLQQKNQEWRAHLPILQHNSQSRLSNNPKYYEYLERQRFDDDNDYTEELADAFSERDPQLVEAVNIVKDMIIIETKERQSHQIGATDVSLIPE